MKAADNPQAAAEEAKAVLAFETRPAEASMTRVEEEDLPATYHKFARAELAAAMPGFNGEAYFAAIGMPAAASHGIVRQPGFFKEVAVMAHEMTHGFDDQGRKFDASGRLQDWWTSQDAQESAVRVAPPVKQYDATEPLPDLAVNGQLTLSENIADPGGLKIA